MDPEAFKEFTGLITVFSKFIINNKLPTEKYAESFTKAFYNFAKIQKLGDSKELVKLNHYINNHQDSLLKLQCGTGHCIECYAQIVQVENYIEKETMCTCRQKIAPNFRKKILESQERIQKLKETCIVCDKKKDRMEFILNGSHMCMVCTSCIEKTFDYDAEENHCGCCNERFDENCDHSIRIALETKLDAGVVKQHYKANCPQCGEGKDRREFVQTCKDNACVACKKCIDNKKNTKDEVCWCGGEITILA